MYIAIWQCTPCNWIIVNKINTGIKRPEDFVPIPDQVLDETMIPQFERIASLYPDRIAIKSSEIQLSYQELNNAVNNLTYQIEQVMGEERSPAAFLFSDEVFSIVAILAVMKSGRPLVGIHPGNSPDLINGVLEDSTARLLITNSRVTQKLSKTLNIPADVQVLYTEDIDTKSKHQDPDIFRVASDPLGIFYTSGSTGLSKGILCNHRSRAHTIQYMVNEWFISSSDRIALLTSVCYLAAYPSLFGALLTGAKLCVFDLKTHSAQVALNWILEEELTVFRSTPTIFRAIFSLVPEGRVFSKLRFITLGGETVTDIDIELFRSHTTKDCVVINNYASTETGSISHYPVGHDTPLTQGILPVGYPAPGKEVILVDENGDEVTGSQEGEIVVKSPYLNLGYWRKPELTAQKFHQIPSDSDEGIYFTGDIGRWGEYGELITLGRKDSQVKVRGYRIQLEAIDHALLSIDEIKDAITIVYNFPRSGDRLVSYIVAPGNKSVSISVLRKQLEDQLLSYMIPSVFVQMDSLPMTATGKPVRRKLPPPTRQRPELETPFVGSRNNIEKTIAEVWKNVLELDQIGVNDNFFELGGDSLIAMEMTLEIESALSKFVPQKFFTNPTVLNLAELLSISDMKENVQGEFILESYENARVEGRIKKPNQSRIKNLLSHNYSLDDFDRLVDKMVGKYLVKLPYLDALQWSVEWSQKEWTRNLLYQRRSTLFSRWLEEIEVDPAKFPNAFQMNLMTNMQFRLPRPLDKARTTMSELRRYQHSPYLFWRTLGELIESVPLGEMNEYFPVKKLENMMEAYQKGKGVVLVSFHGTPRTGVFSPLKRLLQVDELPTISYQIPIRQSQFQDRKDKRSEVAAATLNAEIAMYGQRHLLNGGIINFASDTDDDLGRTYKVSVGGRIQQIKGGFAELALNAGAEILPFTRYCLSDGRVQLEFGEPLQAGDGDRHEKTERLIHKYAGFIEASWRAHPDAINWTRIKRYLNLEADS